MRTITLLLMAFCLGATFSLSAQNTSTGRSKVAVLHIDTKGLGLDPVQMGDLTRIELDKTGLFEILDKYDVQYLVEKEQLKLENCYGKICLVEVGKKLGVNKMLTGAVELLGEKIVVSYRLIDVGTATVEKSQIIEFLNLKPQLQSMVSITLRQLLGLSNDADLVSKLTKPDAYESEINNPNKDRLNLSGPRMGVTFITGQTADRMKAPTAEGGIDAIPVMFQFGYQFETAYLNQGGLQALFEFIPIITGLDQSQIIPSVSILHGIRSNKKGWEFAFGPILYINQVAEGFYNNGIWTRTFDWNASTQGAPYPAGAEIVKRFDKRGDYRLTSSFLFAFGKSFKSGRMNVPVNFFYIPSNAGHRFGISVGFNGKGGAYN